MTTVKQWIEALESGKYPKGRQSLKYNGLYCCLGVLAEEDGKFEQWHEEETPPFERVRISGEQGDDDAKYSDEYLTPIDDETITYKLDDAELTAEQQETLANLNDTTTSFVPVVKKIKEMFPEQAGA